MLDHTPAGAPSHPDWSDERTIRDAQIYIAQNDMVEFTRQVAPWFIMERVHVAVCRHLEAVVSGEIDRLMIREAPRGSKSVQASELFPGFYLGHHPSDKIMAGSHNEDLARMFGSEVRALVSSESYQSIFPFLRLSPSRKAAGLWAVDHTMPQRQGLYQAIGTNKGIAGKGFNLGILDDPTSEQDKDNPKAMLRIAGWYQDGFYTRRQPERNAIVIMGTRWRYDDLQGVLERKAREEEEADQWVVLSIPAILSRGATVLVNKLSETDPIVSEEPKLQEGGSFAPKRFPMKELNRSKATLTEHGWDAQYMQTPQRETGGILKRKYWREWRKKKLPTPLATFAFVDTAEEADEMNDASAATIWHIFETKAIGPDAREWNHHHALLAGAWEERVDAVELIDKMEKIREDFSPDWFLVEKRSSGTQLIQEMRRRRLPVRPWLPPGPKGTKGKYPRALAAQLVFAQGGMWYVDGKWSEKVIEQCTRFPYTDEFDLCDTVTMAAIYLRRHFWLQLPMDELTEDEEEEIKNKKMNLKQRRLYAGVDNTRQNWHSGGRRYYG